MSEFTFRQPLGSGFLPLSRRRLHRRWLLKQRRGPSLSRRPRPEALGRRNSYFPWIASGLRLLSYAGMFLASPAPLSAPLRPR